MKCCPKCKRTYSDDTISFCLEDGAILTAPSEPLINERNFRTTEPDFKLNGTSEANKSSWMGLIVLGPDLCLMAGVSIAILSEPNTKKLLKENTTRGYDIVIVLLLVILVIGACMSFSDLKKANKLSV
jgi:hypothetical protein